MSGPVVVDTNILVRAVLSGKGREDAISNKIGVEDWLLKYGSEQLEEMVDVLGYERITKKYKWDKSVVGSLVQWVMGYGRQVLPTKVSQCRDEDDNYVIGLAMTVARRGKVYLVTGDKDILVLNGEIPKVVILRPGEFLKMREEV